MTGGQPLRVGDVFVAGGQPTITYSPRAQYGLETQVRQYLDDRYTILSVSGQTKTGKTVLVRNVLKDKTAILVSGGTIQTASDLWNQVADDLEVNTSLESTRQDTDSESRSVLADLKLGVAGRRSQGRKVRQRRSATGLDGIGRWRPQHERRFVRP